MAASAVAAALRSCIAAAAGPAVLPKLHGRILTSGVASHVYLNNRLLQAYLANGFLTDARRLFDGTPEPNVYTYNIMLQGYCKLGLLDDAQDIFGSAPVKDTVSWNTFMFGLSRASRFSEALDVFVSMVKEGSSSPNEFTFACVAKCCGLLPCAMFRLGLLGLVMKHGYHADAAVEGAFVDMFVKCGNVKVAEQLFSYMETPSLACWNSMLLGYGKEYGVDRTAEFFDLMPERDLVSWNMMMSVLSLNGRWMEVLAMVTQMRSNGIVLDSTSYTCALETCAKSLDLKWGRHLHAHIVRSMLSIDEYMGCALVDLYARCGFLKAARRAFDSINIRNAVPWTVLIGRFVQHGCIREAAELFDLMRAELGDLDDFALSTIMSACIKSTDSCLGGQLHSLCMRSGNCAITAVSNSLIAMYANCGDLKNAESVFDSMPVKDIISWTSMINAFSHIGNVVKSRKFFDSMPTRNVVTWNTMFGAYVNNGAEEEGIRLYTMMLDQGEVKADWVTYSTLLRACADIAAVKVGNQMVAHIVNRGLNMDTSVGNAIITMYSKCGRIADARAVFDVLPSKDLVSWNAIITSYSQHGMGQQSVEMFESMLSKGITPDHISFVSVLSGCSHSGLVQEGKSYFKLMTEVHKIPPGLEHFSCLVDILGRAGLLNEAKDIIENMPMQPSAEIWVALLGACKRHRHIELAEFAAKRALELNPNISGIYMLLASMYKDEGKAHESARVRRLMRDKGIKKNPGYSWMHVGNKVHVFKAEDASHLQIVSIRHKLYELIEKIADVGYLKTANAESQIHHSEKLAVAFGIINVPAWMPIHIMKNLRICPDCHTVIKLIALVTKREIIVRDAIRFHHFVGGSCSCGDYW